MSKRVKILIAFITTLAIVAAILFTLRPRDPDSFVESGKLGSFTRLMVATREGDLDEIRHQIELGASIDKEATIGWTSLEVAIYYKQYDAAHLLLELGANPNHIRELNHVDDGPLRMVIERTDPSNEAGLILFQRLLNLGANPLFEDGELVFLAIVHGRPKLLEALFSAMSLEGASDLAKAYRNVKYRDPTIPSPEIIEVLERFM